MKVTCRNCAASPRRSVWILLTFLSVGIVPQAQAVTSANCVAEQQAYIQAEIDATVHPSMQGEAYGREKAAERRKYLLSGENDTIPWHVAQANLVKNANDARLTVEFHTKSLRERKTEIDSYTANPYRGLLDPRIRPDILRAGAARTRLMICLYEARLRELSGGGSPVRAAAAPPRQPSAPATPQIAATAPTSAADGFRRKLDRAGLKYEIQKNGDYRLLFNVGSTKRTQLIYVSGSTQAIDGVVIREFFAPAAKISTSVNGPKALELLAESHKKKVGSWEIHGDLLMFTAKVSDVIDGADMRSLLDAVVNVADEMEGKLTGADAY
jgi:hypothetical protein